MTYESKRFDWFYQRNSYPEDSARRVRLDQERARRDRAAAALERQIFEATTRDLGPAPQPPERRDNRLRHYIESQIAQHPRQLTDEQRTAIEEDGF